MPWWRQIPTGPSALVHHPTVADDTLVMCRADREDVTTLMTLHGQFSRATGLYINYSKSTIVPMNVDAEMPCRRRSFMLIRRTCRTTTSLKIPSGTPYTAENLAELLSELFQGEAMELRKC